MSCGCSGGDSSYNEYCNSDTPYPQVSPESVPSMISNLAYALYGDIQSDATSGKVEWIIPCDPNSTAEIPGYPRDDGEGLMCYLIRVFTAIASIQAFSVQSAKSAAYTLVFTDANSLIPMSLTASAQITIPINDNVPFAIGTRIWIQQAAATFQVTFGGAGVTILRPTGKTKTNTLNSLAQLTKTGTNTWLLSGDLA